MIRKKCQPPTKVFAKAGLKSIMQNNFLTFQKLNDLDLAKQIADRLVQEGIECYIENNQNLFDPSFSNNTIELDVAIKIKSSDFAMAHKALEDFYQKDLENVDKDYYLFAFTDQELLEIVARPDEWGHFDYQLSQKILKDRGKEITVGIATLLKERRLVDLSKPEAASKYMIYSGYISAIAGGVFGIFIGWMLSYLKKTLPNGQRIFAYREEDRNHGTRMLLLSVVGLLILIFLRWKFAAD